MMAMLSALLRYLAPFLLGVLVAVATVTQTSGSIAVLLVAGALWMFSTAARPAG